MKSGIVREFASIFDALHRLLDLLAVAAGFALAHGYKFGHLDLEPHYQAALLTALLLALPVFRRFYLYQSWRGLGLLPELRQTTLAWATTFLGLTFLAFLFKSGDLYSREWAAVWGVLTLALLLALRLAVRGGLRWARQGGRNSRAIAIVGVNEHGIRVARQLHRHPWTGLRVVGLFQGDRETWTPDCLPEVPLLGGVGDLAAVVADKRIDQVWICLPLGAEDQLRRIVFDALRFSTIDIHLVPDMSGLNLLNHSIGEMVGIPVISLNVSPLIGWNRWVKAVEDRVLASLILLLISPLMLAIAVGVKLASPGPVLFRQMRYGWAGEPIEVWKFRSMKVHAEAPGQVTQAVPGDSRITAFGAFLRRTSLDELPQFINVLQGRMSIVGPRPHAVEHNEFFKHHVAHYMQRHKVKPGITGWAQVNGLRGETDTIDKMRRRVEYDLHYIDNWSLTFDLKIMLLTLFSPAARQNAR